LDPNPGAGQETLKECASFPGKRVFGYFGASIILSGGRPLGRTQSKDRPKIPRKKDTILPKEVISHLDQLTPEWLTNVLKRSGALEKGAVIGVEIVDVLARELSSSARLKLSYEPGSCGELPHKLFLKMVHLNFDDEDPLYFLGYRSCCT
jgi:hypothetical protein